MGKKWGTFENLTMWKQKTNPKLVQVLAFKIAPIIFENIGLNP